MSKNNVAIAKAFYTALGEKKVTEMEQYLHPQVQFSTPLAESNGKESYLQAAKNFAELFNSLAIRTAFGEDQQAMVIYDLDFPPPIGKIPGAALLGFQEGLIKKIELFYDARPFERKKDEIFS